MTRSEYRIWLNRQPEVAKDRAALAVFYRKLRADRPEVARLLFVRMRAAYRLLRGNLEHNLYHHGTGAGMGLHDFYD